MNGRNYRPVIHFTAPSGWINDPNGLVFFEGKYHLFYQHFPHGNVCGSMHWGHAVSKDLIRWNHLPIAIYPDQNGMIYSGSAVVDTNNLSGLGKKDSPPLIALYTCHGDKEEQAIAYSLDGISFTKYEKNPIIPNPGISDFRDPKLFWNPLKDCWSMVLAAKDRVHFYATKDFLSWVKTGEFGPGGNHAPGIWECPDMVPFEHDRKPVWMLIVSMTTTAENGKANTQYFLGDFDGDAFICTMPFGHMEKIDYGCDYYAGVTFNNVKSPIFISWGLNWEYASQTPTGKYCGQMALPLTLSLKETPAGLRLASAPMNLRKNIGEIRDITNEGTLDSETFWINIKGNSACSIMLTNNQGQSLSFGVDENNNLFVNRTNAGKKDFNQFFSKPDYSIKKVNRFFDGSYSMDFIFDVSILELFIDDGTRHMTMVCYPDTPYNKVIIDGDTHVNIFNFNFRQGTELNGQKV